MQSGKIRRGAQSPPPMTLPALAEAILAVLFRLKKEWRYEDVMISDAALEAL